jgi:hypothetical protein
MGNGRRLRSVLMLVAVIALIAVSGFVIWDAPTSVTAQDDAVPALQTQVADLERRVTALEGGAASPVSDSPIADAAGGMVISGTGPGLSDPFELESGRYMVLFTCSEQWGVAEFIGEDASAFYPAVFASLGEQVEEMDAGRYLIQVNCPGNWELTITPFDL